MFWRDNDLWNGQSTMTFLWTNETISKRPNSYREWLFYLPVVHRNLSAALFLISEEESQNAGGIKAAGPWYTRSDTDKQQMRAATGEGDKRTVLSTAVASAKSQPAGLLHRAFLLIHQNAYACSLLRTRARTHTIISKAGLIFERSHPAFVFSHWFSLGMM